MKDYPDFNIHFVGITEVNLCFFIYFIVFRIIATKRKR
jgi:hypothetical protein